MAAAKCQYCKHREGEGSDFDRHEMLIRHNSGSLSHASCAVKAIPTDALRRAWFDNLPLTALGCCPRKVLAAVFTESEVGDRVARGLSISHSTILRWVVRYADTCEKSWHRFERPVGGSWRVDETFIKQVSVPVDSAVSKVADGQAAIERGKVHPFGGRQKRQLDCARSSSKMLSSTPINRF